MILDMASDRIEVFDSIRMLQRTLHRIRFSYTKPRPEPHRSASTEEQELFKEKTER